MPATRTRSAVLTVCVALSLSWSEGKAGEAVDDAVCAQLAQQSSVEYRPDVNAQGQAVAPADLGGRSSFQLPEEITIPLAVDAIERYGGKNAGSAVKGEAGLGTITVRGGQVFFNGTLVAQMDRAAPGPRPAGNGPHEGPGPMKALGGHRAQSIRSDGAKTG